MIRRLFALGVLAWALGFALFVTLLPRPAGNDVTDGVVVLTGATGRIARGSDIVERHLAQRMLISGVEPNVTIRQLAEKQDVPLPIVECCVDLGRQAIDTQSNARETAIWVKRHRFTSIRLVTTDWHMARARFELSRALDAKTIVIPDAVRGDASLFVLFREYNKYLLRRTAALVGI